MAEDLFQDTNVKVYDLLRNSMTPLGVNIVENQEIIYESLKDKIIQKMDILGNRIEKILELNENILNNNESILLFQSVKTIYQELILLKEDVNILKEDNHKETN